MSTHLFHLIPDSFAVLVSKRGVYRQAKLYRRGDEVFAGHGGGFVRIVSGGGTSVPDIRWDGLESELTFVAGRLGRMLVGVETK